MSPPDPDGPPAARLRAAAEAVLLAAVVVAPWPYASVQWGWQVALHAAVLVLAALWAAVGITTGRLAVRLDGPTVCLLGVVLLTAVQLVPLPEAAVGVLSPARLDQHRTLRPAVDELLPDEPGPPARRPGWLPLTVDPPETRGFLAQLLAVTLVYALTRNVIASPGAFHRLAWAGFANGLVIAVLALARLHPAGRQLLPFWETTVLPGFGPFVDRDHYPYFMALAAGLGLGLFLTAARTPADPWPGAGWDGLPVAPGGLLGSPVAAALLAGVCLMAASIPVTLSRGGALALAAAGAVTAAVGWGGRGGHPGRWRAAAVAAAVLALVAWLGWKPVAARLGTLGAKAGVADRLWLWRDAAAVWARYPLVGAGGGAYPRAEPAVRSTSAMPQLIVNSVHNDYLEAAAEGGVVRLGLTFGLVVTSVGAAGAAARRLRRHPVGPLLLGGVFGLTAVAAHSAVDFGLHNPAVALLAAVVAAHAAAAGDAGRGRRAAPPTGPRPPRVVSVAGPAVWVVTGVLLLAAAQAGWTAWRSLQVERYRAAAGRATAAGQLDTAVALLEAAARVRPDDAEVWNDLAALHLSAGRAHATPARLAEGLRAARTARDLCPLLPGPHLRLGAHAGDFARGEPADVHFDRAKRVAGFDPDVWYLSGAAAYARGARDAAWADWRESLARAPRRLGVVVRTAARDLDPDALRARVLPDDPAVWAAALESLDLTPPERRAWLRAAADRWAAGPEPAAPAGWSAWAAAAEGAGDRAAALAVLRRAAARFPDAAPVRDRLAAALADAEEEAEAVPHLEWLVAREPGRPDYRDRLEAARRALRLRAEIGGP